MEYTDAKESLLQAAQNAPVEAIGFRVQCNKWAITVHLLLGETTESKKQTGTLKLWLSLDLNKNIKNEYKSK